ncbi:MAG TPA: transporter substrate-binding domain-containing protein [Alphaproteobacteria bacterium]|nr:transporter substrate-binding domain-containing protein [Alphaproteobacteria bacterium]
MTRKIFVFFFLLLMGSTTLAQAEEKESAYERVIRTGTIRCGYIAWKPYFYYQDLNDPSSKTGISFDLMNTIGKTLDLKIEWTEEVGWGNIGEGLKAGRYDMACVSMWPDAPKYKNFLLTRPMYYSAIYSWVRADDNRFDGDINKINKPDVKIAAVDGAFSYNLAKEIFPDAGIASISPMAQSAEYYMTVVSGKADIINTDSDEMAAFLENNAGKLRMVKDVEPLRLYPHVMGIPADSPQMKDMVDSALGFLIDNGFMDGIVKKYNLELVTPQKGMSEK